MSLPVPLPDPEIFTQMQAYLRRLEKAATTLNELSDQLTKQVKAIETVVNSLNLGITTHVNIGKWSTEDGSRTDEWSLLYDKESGKWGFVIMCVVDDDSSEIEYKTWAFKDAPREQRIKAVEKIPLLLEALLKKSTEVASDITHKVNYAKSIASSLSLQKPNGVKR